MSHVYVRYVCATEEGSGPLAATAPNTSLPCTRFWLGGTVAGSYALRSVTNGLYVATVNGTGLLAASATDPRQVASDSARWWLVTAPEVCAAWGMALA